MSTTMVVVGTLYVYCPDEASNAVRPQLDRLYSGACHSEFSSDGNTIFGVADVPYPVEQARYGLANLYQSFWRQGYLVSWSWSPPAGAVVLPGGTVSLMCRREESAALLQGLQSLFPGAYLYQFPGADGWVNCDVDTPCPDAALWTAINRLVLSVSGWVSYRWHPWCDEMSV